MSELTATSKIYDLLNEGHHIIMYSNFVLDIATKDNNRTIIVTNQERGTQAKYGAFTSKNLTNTLTAIKRIHESV